MIYLSTSILHVWGNFFVYCEYRVPEAFLHLIYNNIFVHFTELLFLIAEITLSDYILLVRNEENVKCGKYFWLRDG